MAHCQQNSHLKCDERERKTTSRIDCRSEGIGRNAQPHPTGYKPLTNHENFEANGIETGQTLGSIEPAVEKQNPRAALVSGNPGELCLYDNGCHAEAVVDRQHQP